MMSQEVHKDYKLKDYGLTGANSAAAVESGLADADWYTTPVPRELMRSLHQRKDWPGIRDSVLYFGLILLFGYLTYRFWGEWYALIPMMVYGVLYASASDARWHESSHGSAFRTDWMNNVLYEIASFMVLRESVPWRWSHTRHHSDTIIVGRDPEIAVPRPPSLLKLFLKSFNFQAFRRYFNNLFLHSFGRLTEEEKSFIPEEEAGKVFIRARIYVVLYTALIGSCVYFNTWLPLIFILGPNLYGAWLMPIYGWTQHAGLAEDVLDHRLNCRTIKMNFVNRFLYWNMNYHLEHHMFPLVPYHQLPKLHEAIKHDCPDPYTGLVDTYREIIPAVLRQRKEPGYYVVRELPEAADHQTSNTEQTQDDSAAGATRQSVDGWVEVCAEDDLDLEDVIRFDHQHRTFAIYRSKEGALFATDGICTHGNTHLADGLVKGKIVECPKHNGRFDVESGKAVRQPACVALKTYEVKSEGGRVSVKLGTGKADQTDADAMTFRVVSNKSVASFIKELVLEPLESTPLEYLPGQYMHLEIPHYDSLSYRDFDIDSKYEAIWQDAEMYSNWASNAIVTKRNYSIATAPGLGAKQLKFNVRVAVSPKGDECSSGVGSSYVFSLKSGDEVRATGGHGDFLIKDSEAEMVYLGGGAGMAPLRSHLSYLFEVLKTKRKVSFWYGARSKQEVFYESYFRALEDQYENFQFHVVLSDSPDEEAWGGPKGFVHDYLREAYLNQHASPELIEYYLCGPPIMVQVARDMLKGDFHVPCDGIACDEF